MKQFLLFSLFALCTALSAETMYVDVENPLSVDKTDAPVVLRLTSSTRSALVSLDGKEIPCQLDDLDQDGSFDELVFLTDIAAKSKQRFKVELAADGEPRQYAPRVFAEMAVRNAAVKKKNKHNIFIRSLTLERGSNIYSMIHHHGPAFESELVGFRIYFDKRQTVDLYGKYHKRLEIKETQFYPDSAQLAMGYGDDVLWAGNSFGLGALRGWNGTNMVMFDDETTLTESILAYGPLRTIVEIVNRDWNTGSSQLPRITMTTRYILYAGHRDCEVSVSFDRPAADYRFSTGITNIPGSKEMSDHKGLRACWGTAWAVGGKDTLTHHPETVGLAICLPESDIIEERQADKENYPFILGDITAPLIYYISFCSANEDNGFKSSDEWFDYLTRWKRSLPPLKIRKETVL